MLAADEASCYSCSVSAISITFTTRRHKHHIASARSCTATPAASSGSACASGSLEPSHVLLAMGRSAEQAHGSLRFSLGPEITEEALDQVVAVLAEQIPNLRSLLQLEAGATW